MRRFIMPKPPIKADAASGKGEGSLEIMGEYEYQGDSTGTDNEGLKERLFPENQLKKELSEANEKMQEIINAIPGSAGSMPFIMMLPGNGRNRSGSGKNIRI